MKPTDITENQQASNENKTEETIRLEKLTKLKSQTKHPFKYTFSKTHKTTEIHENFNTLETGESDETTVTLAGRLMAKRDHGKAFFGNLQDEFGIIQLYANANKLGEETFNDILSYDVGDIIGIVGNPFKTKRGELTIKVTKIELLTKSLLPLPEKYHGLQNIELRYRHRYIDLISNPHIKETFKIRSKSISFIRNYLEKKEFMEVETPVLHNIYGGANAKPFNTFHNELEQNLYLRIALELHLKRLIVGGFEKVFEIGRVFRNEGISYKHNPEYTLLELYEAYTDYHDMMNLTEELLSALVFNIHNSYKIVYKDTEIDFTPPFKRIKLVEEIQNKCNIDCNNINELRNKAKELNLNVSNEATKGHLIMELYDSLIEPTLIQPTFIIDHPWETSPLAKKHRENDNLVERFELIINGMEIANAFSELNDPEDQFDRFQDQLKAKEKGMEDSQVMDLDYIQALKQGLPPTGGLGIGIDRIVMLLTNSHSIRDVLLFPHMRDKNE